MNTITKFLLRSALLFLMSFAAHGQGFTDSYVTFYGEIRQVGGAGTTLLQSGQLELTFVNQAKSANRITLETELRPVGTGSSKPYSYSLKVPLAYLPEAPRLGEYLAISAAETDFKIETITIDGTTATLPDGSKEFFGLSFASRAKQYRLDLLVIGDPTDNDGDSLPDWWESLHGLDTTLADANSDIDNDGWSNLEEFLRGSNPQESNLEPTLATAELFVPERGEAGCYLQFHDSDTTPADIFIEATPASLQGFEIRWSGEPLDPADMPPISLAAIQSGRLSIAHLDPANREASLPLTWNDGGEEKSGSVLLRVTNPSATDGNDAALWLDAAALPTDVPLSSWTDRSGNSHNAVQPVEANRPTVRSSGSHQAVAFTEATSHLFLQDSALPTGNHTILAAWKSSGSRHEPEVVFSSNRGFLSLDPTAQALSYPGAPLYQTDDLAVRGYESTLGTTSTAIFRREGTTLQNIFGLSYNGEQVATETIDPVLPTIGARRLALPVAEPISNTFQGELHELLIFPTALPEQKLRDVHDYLQSKWSGFITWDFSTDLHPVTLTAAGSGRHIIRGGHGDDDLRGGEEANILSGGPGADTLHGGPGHDTFVFGGIDTGEDQIIDFGDNDIIDLSALFWGQSGDARQFLTTRLETNFDSSVPTLDTVLIVQRSETTTQEIILRDRIIGTSQLVELIVEGRLRMGGLSIPTEVSLAPASGSEDNTVLHESLDDPFTIEITRNGDGVAGAIEVPIGLFQDALGRDLVVEGSANHDGQRVVVKFERGETSKLITFRPVPDLESEGTERWQTSILPNFRYAVAGGPVARSVSDSPSVHFALIEANALTSGQAARVRVVRDGSTSSPLTVALDLKGTALEGTHLNSIPRSVTIPAGQAFTEIAITTESTWNGSMTRMAMLRLVSQSTYQLGHPHEATIYASASANEADKAGFDRWLTAATEGRFSNLSDLLRNQGPEDLSDYVRAYAFGRQSSQTAAGTGLAFRLVDNKPELRARIARTAADLQWQVQSSDAGKDWIDVSPRFAEDLNANELSLLGPPRATGESKRLYRLAFSVETESNLGAGLNNLTSSRNYGMSGLSPWQSDPSTGHLVSTADTPSSISRLIVEVDAPTSLNFDMSVQNGDGSDSLSFYIDGVRVAQTSGDATHITQTLSPTEPVILMWEFHRSAGQAVIATALDN